LLDVQTRQLEHGSIVDLFERKFSVDALGGGAAGWEAALIKPVGNDVLGLGPPPQVVGDDLKDVAEQLIARHNGRAYWLIRVKIRVAILLLTERGIVL
jgi:2-haloacid dehalogenase